MSGAFAGIRRIWPRSGVAAEANDFQDDLDALIGTPVPLLLQAWPAVGACLVAGLLLVAAVTRIDVVVTAPGRLAADVPPVVLQPLDSAVLRAVNVKPGDRVAAGEVLAVLDSTFTVADREALNAQRRALEAQAARLRAELSDTPAGPAEGAEAALQNDLQVRRQQVMSARRAALQAALDAAVSAEASERAAGSGIDERLRIASEIEAMRGNLVESKFGSRLSLLEATAARLSVEQEQRAHLARLQELDSRVSAARADLDAFVRDWHREALETLASIGPELARIEEQLAKAERLDALTLLRAPRDAVVLEVAEKAPGSVMRPGDAVVTLVPSDVPLIAEVALPSSEIGQIGPGTHAVLKIDSFPWRRNGTIDGRLRAVSLASWPARDGASGGVAAGGVALHKAQVELTTPHLRDLPEGAAPLPGMTLSAELTVGERSVLDFFLQPLVRGLHEALREP